MNDEGSDSEDDLDRDDAQDDRISEIIQKM
jgi:hypothetical protein